MDKLKKILFIILIILAIVLIILIFNDMTLELDNYIYYRLISLKNDFLTNTMIMISNFGGTFFITTLTILSIIFLKKRIYSILITTNILGNVAICQLLKYTLKRPRPIYTHLVNVYGFSFPSGHAMASLAFYGLIIYFIFKSNLSKNKKNLIIFLILLLIVLIGISRMYLGVHYFTDVIAGFIFSLIYLLVFINCIKKYIKDE